MHDPGCRGVQQQLARQEAEAEYVSDGLDQIAESEDRQFTQAQIQMLASAADKMRVTSLIRGTDRVEDPNNTVPRYSLSSVRILFCPVLLPG